MAFFKFRKNGDEASATLTQPESLEMMRKRAKHRLLGAALLVIVGVVGFPLLFDKQPRPIAVDIPIEVPDRSKVKPLLIPAPVVTPAPAAVPASAAASAPVPLLATPKLQIPATESIVATKLAEKFVEKPVEKPASAPAKTDDAARAQALLDGQEPSQKPEAAGRFVVQVGAFAEAARVRDVRQKVEQLGLKTYTQQVDTKEGRRIRVRVGPYATRLEADKAAEKIKTLKLHASTLSL